MMKRRFQFRFHFSTNPSAVVRWKHLKPFAFGMPFSCSSSESRSSFGNCIGIILTFFSISNSQTKSFTLLEIVSHHNQQTPTHCVVQLCACKRHRTNRKTILLKSFSPTTIRFLVFVHIMLRESWQWLLLFHDLWFGKCHSSTPRWIENVCRFKINMQMAFGWAGFKWVVCFVGKCGTHTLTHDRPGALDCSLFLISHSLRIIYNK